MNVGVEDNVYQIKDGKRTMKNRMLAGVALASLLSFSLAPAAFSNSDGDKAHLLANSGTVMVKSTDQHWTKLTGDTLNPGDSIMTTIDGEAVVRLPGQSVVRVAPNSQLRLTQLGENTQLSLDRGGMLAQANGNMEVTTASSVAQASNGEFSLRTSKESTQLDVLSGDARLLGQDGNPAALKQFNQLPEGVDSTALAGLDESLTGTQVALEGEGPDVRSRDRDRDEFVGGEENTGRGVGEDPPPSPQPQPPAPQTSPPPQPTPPQPSGPPQDLVTQPGTTGGEAASGGGGGGGGNAAMTAGGIGAGIVILALLNGDDNDEEDNGQGFVPNTGLPVPSPSTP